jgi:glycosyltransferase involved in cell wall biosynthesis
MVDKDSPKISIITPSYNSVVYIDQAIESVLEQDYTEFEHIIVDGGSTDGTTEVLQRYPHLNVISESDSGIYDAVNKGLQEATGELIGWLNSDDVYADRAFNKVVAEYFEHPDSDLIAGNCEIFRCKGDTEETIERLEFTHPPSSEDHTSDHSGTRLNSCFLTQDLVKKTGNFNSSLRIAGDTDYLIRIMARQPTISKISDLVYRYRSHQESLTFSDSDEFDETAEIWMNEAMRFMNEYSKDTQLPNPLRNYCFSNFRERSGILFKEYIKHGQVRSAFSTAVYCTRHDSLWPIWMANKAFNKYI